MAHKSHRQKALQSQLEERPAISLITNEEKPKKKITKKVKPSTTASALASSGSMDVDEPTQVPEAQHVEDDDGDILIDNATASTSNTAPVASTSTSSGFAPLALGKSNGVLKNEFRRIPVPAHRMSPLRRDWVAMYTPMVEHLGLQVRMNEKRRCVEIRVSSGCGLLLLSHVCISYMDECFMLLKKVLQWTKADPRHQTTRSTQVPSKREPILSKPTS
jgi:RNA-binding protein PNO1